MYQLISHQVHCVPSSKNVSYLLIQATLIRLSGVNQNKRLKGRKGMGRSAGMGRGKRGWWVVDIFTTHWKDTWNYKQTNKQANMLFWFFSPHAPPITHLLSWYFRLFMQNKSYTMWPLMTDFFHLVQYFPGLPMLQHVLTPHSHFSWIVFLYMDISWFACPILSWWAFGLF